MHIFNNHINPMILKAIGRYLLEVNFIIFIAGDILPPIEMEQFYLSKWYCDSDFLS